MRKVFTRLTVVLIIASSCLLCSGCAKRAIISQEGKYGAFHAKLDNGTEIVIQDDGGFSLKVGMVVGVKQYKPPKDRWTYWRITRVISMPKE